MQYFGRAIGSVSKTWNSINPATLSGAIDVIVVEQSDGQLASSPFHVRFGKFSTFRPSQKKVDVTVNGVKTDLRMKLGEEGEAFFVFETDHTVPKHLLTSPVISPSSSPETSPGGSPSSPSPQNNSDLQEPEYLDINKTPPARPISSISDPSSSSAAPSPSSIKSENILNQTKNSLPSTSQNDPSSVSLTSSTANPAATFPSLNSPATSPVDSALSPSATSPNLDVSSNSLSISSSTPPSPEAPLSKPFSAQSQPEPITVSSISPKAELDSVDAVPNLNEFKKHGHAKTVPICRPALSPEDRKAILDKADKLSQKFNNWSIPARIREDGQIYLDTTGYKYNEQDAARAEETLQNILREELGGTTASDIEALIAKEELNDNQIQNTVDYSSDPNNSSSESSEKKLVADRNIKSGKSDTTPSQTISQTNSNKDDSVYSENTKTSTNTSSSFSTVESTQSGEKSFVKTLRLTSDQLLKLSLKKGGNTISFAVNQGKATCNATVWYWEYTDKIVISDIDGTITKSDALGQVLTMIGKDWTHAGVAKLYADIAENGYKIMYLTSRSVGLADTTKNYLLGVEQDGYKLPNGPVILSPDRTIAAFRREVILRKPEVFKMATLRDIKFLFGNIANTPFYAGFGNRITDALSYRSVGVPSSRIFTINFNGEVHMELLELAGYKSSYVNLTDVVDQFFPPVKPGATGGHEEFSDVNYWRDPVPSISDDEDDTSTDVDIINSNSSRKNSHRSSISSISDSYSDSDDSEGSATGSESFTESDTETDSQFSIDDDNQYSSNNSNESRRNITSSFTNGSDRK